MRCPAPHQKLLGVSLARRLRQIAQLSGREWADLAVATWRLGEAALAIARATSPQIRQLARDGEGKPVALTHGEERLIERIAWALPRAANIVPWRADCLRQAEAGRRWLARHRIHSEIRLGARRDAQGQPEMHAWLVTGERVVTGGDISSYSPFGADAVTPH